MLNFLDSILHFFSQLFASYSPEANDINNLFLKYLILAGIIIALVAGLVIVGAIRFSSKKHPGEPKQIFGNKKLEITWTLVPFLILVFFFALTLRAMEEINSPVSENRKPDIIIVAHQWWWDMRYPEYKIITANELHIPVGKKLLMEIESADVIHDWWVPALGRKIDAVPGRKNYTWIEADSAGTYEGTCAEFCGAEHAWMRIKVIAQTKPYFDKWINDQQQVPAAPKDSTALLGDMLFQKETCGDCHAIAGTPADAHVGPDLTHIASRETILSGRLTNTRENLTRWLADPQKVKPGAHMPDFRFNRPQINELVTYLEGLK